MGSLTSNNFDTAGGSGTITIIHASLTGGTTFEVSEFGEIKGVYDNEDDSENATSVLFNLGEITFTVFDRMDDGSSFFGQIDALLSTDEITLDISLTTRETSRAVNDSFVFFKNDINYNRDARTIQVEAKKITTPDLQIDIATFFTNEISASESETFSIAGTPDCIDAKTFLDNALPLFNSSNTSINASENFSITGKTATNTFIVVNDSAASSTDVDELLFEMAAAEGAIVGSLMGYNFFNNRSNTTTRTVSLSQDDIEENSLKINPGRNGYAGIEVNFEGNSSNYLTWNSRTRITTLAEDLTLTETGVDVTDAGGIAAGDVILVNTELMYVESKATNTLTVIRGYKSQPTTHSNGDSVNGTFNPDARDTLLVTFRNNVMAYATWDGTEYDDVGGNTDGFLDVANDGKDAYGDAYGASGTRRIEFTVLGIDSVKPYQAVEFDTSFPSIIQGKFFRPNEITYNWQENKIKVKAYEVT